MNESVFIPAGTAPSHIYFTTDEAGLKVYSLETSTVSTIVEGEVGVALNGVALDAKNNELYYTAPEGKIFRVNTDGSGIEARGSNVNRELISFAIQQ